MRSESFLANPSFRAHLLWVTGGFTGALLLTGAVAAFLPLFQRFDAGVGSDAELERLTFEILRLHASLWPVVGAALLSTLACSWLLYGRMRGPLFRFVSVFRALSSGSVPESVVIRATDYVQEESAELNAMLEALRERERARAEALAQLDASAAGLGEWAHAQGSAEAIALVSEFEERCKALRPGGPKA
ncbi:MAG TPA: hypothetical protein VII78_01310 [Myxococcota bacterium]|jgi:hypothetical protein